MPVPAGISKMQAQMDRQTEPVATDQSMANTKSKNNSYYKSFIERLLKM